MATRRPLVLDGAGFTGSHLCQRLLSKRLDEVYHFAFPAKSPADFNNLPITKVGALGNYKNALGLAEAKGPRFMLAPTSEAYGDPWYIHPPTKKGGTWGTSTHRRVGPI